MSVLVACGGQQGTGDAGLPGDAGSSADSGSQDVWGTWSGAISSGTVTRQDTWTIQSTSPTSAQVQTTGECPSFPASTDGGSMVWGPLACGWYMWSGEAHMDGDALDVSFSLSGIGVSVHNSASGTLVRQ